MRMLSFTPLHIREISVKSNGVVSLGIALFFFAIIAYLHVLGDANKVFTTDIPVQTITEPSHAYTVWAARGVKNRVLFLLDRKINADPGVYTKLPDDDLKVLSTNYLYIAFRKNIIRQVYHIIPDSSWGEVERYMRNNPNARVADGGFRISIEGTPVIVMRMQDISKQEEPALISINTGFWDDSGLERIAGLLKATSLTTDLITIAGTLSTTARSGLEAYAGK